MAWPSAASTVALGTAVSSLSRLTEGSVSKIVLWSNYTDHVWGSLFTSFLSRISVVVFVFRGCFCVRENCLLLYYTTNLSHRRFVHHPEDVIGSATIRRQYGVMECKWEFATTFLVAHWWLIIGVLESYLVLYEYQSSKRVYSRTSACASVNPLSVWLRYCLISNHNFVSSFCQLWRGSEHWIRFKLGATAKFETSFWCFEYAAPRIILITWRGNGNRVWGVSGILWVTEYWCRWIKWHKNM